MRLARCDANAVHGQPNCEAYIEIGYALALLGRYQEAEPACQSAINAQPTYYKPYYDAGLFSYEMRDFAAAEKRWLKAVRLNPSHTRARVVPRLRVPANRQNGTGTAAGATESCHTQNEGRN
jgi:tetratricopeptide (TPR) repeat protein